MKNRALALYYHLAVIVALMEAPACMRLKLCAVVVLPLLDLGRLFSLDFILMLDYRMIIGSKYKKIYICS